MLLFTGQDKKVSPIDESSKKDSVFTKFNMIFMFSGKDGAVLFQCFI